MSQKHVVIVGGGIAGLAAAYHLQTRGSDAFTYTLIERASTFGGKLVTHRENGFVVEGGPDSFLTQKPAALELCRELGLDNELIGTNDAVRQVFVWSRGRLHPLPEGVMLMVPTKLAPFLKSSLISWRGKVRLGIELLVPRRLNNEDESLAHFVRRRLGHEMLDKIAEPMIAGIYVANAEDLSLASTFPRFLEMEQQYGGLLRAMQAQRSAPRAQNGNGTPLPMFMSLRGGMQRLSDALVARLDANALQTNRRVVAVTRTRNQYAVALDDGQTLDADAVVLATPAFVTADIVRDFDPALATQLRQIRYVSSATISLGFVRSQVKHPLNGFGFLVPRSEKRKLIACTWSSVKFNARAAADHVLLRAFVGGARAEHLAEQDEETLIQIVRDELREMMGITAEPEITKVYRWHKANPQYDVGHQTRIEKIQARAATHPNLFLIGSAYRGIGIPDCIRDSMRAAEELIRWNGVYSHSEELAHERV